MVLLLIYLPLWQNTSDNISEEEFNITGESENVIFNLTYNITTVPTTASTTIITTLPKKIITNIGIVMVIVDKILVVINVGGIVVVFEVGYVVIIALGRDLYQL